MIYQIRVKGHLVHEEWADWFQELTVVLEKDGEMLLTGPMVDQAALHGLLKRVRDLGMPLLSVNRVGPDQEDSGDTKRLDGPSLEKGEGLGKE